LQMKADEENLLDGRTGGGSFGLGVSKVKEFERKTVGDRSGGIQPSILFSRCTRFTRRKIMRKREKKITHLKKMGNYEGLEESYTNQGIRSFQ